MRIYPNVRAFCLFFLSSLNSSNFKSIRLRALTVFFVPLELTLLMSILCPSRAVYQNHQKRRLYQFADYLPNHSLFPLRQVRPFLVPVERYERFQREWKIVIVGLIDILFVLILFVVLDSRPKDVERLLLTSLFVMP